MFKERIYKIWKQFTTTFISVFFGAILCSKNEYTKSESNSQQLTREVCGRKNCVQRTNIQNLKAIHNTYVRARVVRPIVFKERIYKIWKQFTTKDCVDRGRNLLCSKNEYTKSESNSQRTLVPLPVMLDCVQRTNIQNLKAIHNLSDNSTFESIIVFKERIYKIWKQFTTNVAPFKIFTILCSKNEYTKSESNSQPHHRLPLCRLHCVQRTNIQNLKAIHNRINHYVTWTEKSCHCTGRKSTVKWKQ